MKLQKNRLDGVLTSMSTNDINQVILGSVANKLFDFVGVLPEVFLLAFEFLADLVVLCSFDRAGVKGCFTSSRGGNEYIGMRCQNLVGMSKFRL